MAIAARAYIYHRRAARAAQLPVAHSVVPRMSIYTPHTTPDGNMTTGCGVVN